MNILGLNVFLLVPRLNLIRYNLLLISSLTQEINMYLINSKFKSVSSIKECNYKFYIKSYLKLVFYVFNYVSK